MIKVALSLLAIGGTCGLLLVGTDLLTSDDISVNREARARQLMADMLGTPLDHHWNIQTDTFGACDNWLFSNVVSNGYAGDINLVVLWRADTGGLVARVTQHRETPGIGDFIDHSRSDWITALDARTATAFSEVDNVSGATITTAAIRRAAQTAQQQVEDYCG